MTPVQRLHRSESSGRDGLTLRLGGPVRLHGWPRGFWFDPGPFAMLSATLIWIICIWHQTPCLQSVAGEPVDAYLRLCYSDIPLSWTTTGLGTGETPYQDYPPGLFPVVVLVQLATRGILSFFGAVVSPDATAQQRLDVSNDWFALTGGVLFAFLLVLVSAHLLMGSKNRDAPHHVGETDPIHPGLRHLFKHRRRSWDAIYVAAAPVIAAAGMVSWDLVPAALTAVALLLWASKRLLPAGIMLAVAASSAWYPLLIIAGLVILLRRSQTSVSTRNFWLGLSGTWLLINVPLILIDGSAWMASWSVYFPPAPGLGSVWFILSDAGVPMPPMDLLSGVLIGALVLVMAVTIPRLSRRPRLGQVAFVFVAVATILSPSYAPQHVLWVLPLLVLARPVFRDWAAFTVVELAYFWAVWAHLGGSSQQSGVPYDVLYWAVIIIRIVILSQIVYEVIQDMRRPWEDPVRRGLVDDPIGGVLDHTADRALANRNREESAPRGVTVDDAHVTAEEGPISEKARISEKDYGFSRRDGFAQDPVAGADVTDSDDVADPRAGE